MLERLSQKTISQPVAVAGLLLSACFWGGNFVVAKDVMSVLTPNWMLAIRMFFALLIMVIAYRKTLKTIRKSDIKGCVITGLFMGAAYASMTAGLSHLNAGTAAFITDTYIIWIPIVLFIVWKVKPGPHIFIAAALAITGVGFMTLQHGFHISIGGIITILGSFFWTGLLISIDIYSKKIESQILVTSQTFFVLVVTLSLALILREEPPTMEVLIQPKLIIQFAYLVVFATFVANSCQNFFQRYVSSATVAVVFPSESVFATVFGVVFLGEVLSPMTTVGMSLLVVAILVNTLGHKIFRPKIVRPQIE